MKRWNSQAGMSLVETIISLGILGIVFVGGGVKMKSVQERINRVRALQSADALQGYLRMAMADEQNIKDSVPYLPTSTLKTCLQSGSGCRDGLNAVFPIYAAGKRTPITGSNVRYTRDGAPCGSANCGPISVTSRLQLFCTPGGWGKQTCSKGRYMAVEFSIRDEERKGKDGKGALLLRDAVEVDVRDESYVKNLSLTCAANEVIRGIGLTGAALCTSLSDIKYADAATMKAGEFLVKPKDCRPTKKTKKTVTETVTKPDGSTEEVSKEVEVDEPEADNDAKYVESITDKGEIVCADKTW